MARRALHPDHRPDHLNAVHLRPLRAPLTGHPAPHRGRDPVRRRHHRAPAVPLRPRTAGRPRPPDHLQRPRPGAGESARSSIERTERIVGSRRLAHLLGTNQLFVDLIAHARTDPGAGLLRWWSEQHATAAYAFADIHPDGHGIWRTAGHDVGFFLEHDNGTEPLSVVLAKLRGYQRLAEFGPRYPVLLRVPGRRRETNLLHVLAGVPTLMPVAYQHPHRAPRRPGLDPHVRPRAPSLATGAAQRPRTRQPSHQPPPLHRPHRHRRLTSRLDGRRRGTGSRVSHPDAFMTARAAICRPAARSDARRQADRGGSGASPADQSRPSPTTASADG
ncbi:replication-relaxation family protein [Rugosimonospora africana]|uniref:replication-relaxation family protein n=1 Tax=Rugosimonospora africana TaxID=556532 RepID=UPI0035711C97